MRRRSWSAFDSRHVLAIEDDATGRGLDEAVDQLHRRRLAAAGWADEDDDLALGDVHRQVVHGRRGLTGEVLRQVFEPDFDGHLSPFDVVSR